MNSWYDFYKDRVNNISYEEYFKKRYALFLNMLSENMNGNVLEVGCGTSLVTKLVYKNGVSFNILDNDCNMFSLSNKTLQKRLVSRYYGDIRKGFINRYGLIYSHGVLEHFSPAEIRSIIEKQLRVCDRLIHYVPSDKYTYKSFGDELLISKEEWKNICNPDNIIEFNNGYDLILIWRK